MPKDKVIKRFSARQNQFRLTLRRHNTKDLPPQENYKKFIKTSLPEPSHFPLIENLSSEEINNLYHLRDEVNKNSSRLPNPKLTTWDNFSIEWDEPVDTDGIAKEEENNKQSGVKIVNKITKIINLFRHKK